MQHNITFAAHKAAVHVADLCITLLAVIDYTEEGI